MPFDLVTMTDAQIDSIMGEGAAARFHLKTLHSVTNQGRSARAIGMKMEDCPPFVDNDMAVSWRIGWYDEDQRRDPRGFADREAVEFKTEEPTVAQSKKRGRNSENRNREITCPVCGSLPGIACRSANNKVISDEHVARRPRRYGKRYPNG